MRNVVSRRTDMASSAWSRRVGTVFLDKTSEHVAATLERLHDAGIRIALDDFGTGYASLTHLKQFPVDDIKIDQSFVRDLEPDAEDAAIVSALIGLGRSLGMKVIAEGVETAGQLDYLRARSCDFAQGYLFASRCPDRACHGSWRTTARRTTARRVGRKSRPPEVPFIFAADETSSTLASSSVNLVAPRALISSNGSSMRWCAEH